MLVLNVNGGSMFTFDALSRATKNVETFGNGKRRMSRFLFAHGNKTITLIDNLGLATLQELLEIARNIGVGIPEHLDQYPPVSLAT